MTDPQTPKSEGTDGNFTPPFNPMENQPGGTKESYEQFKHLAQTGAGRKEKIVVPLKERKLYKIVASPATANITTAIYTVATITLLILTYSMVDAAKKTLVESQKEFGIANGPNLSLGNVAYWYFPGEGCPPLTPDHPRKISFGINNYSSRLIHIRSFKFQIMFDTLKTKVDSLMNEMKKEKYRISNNAYLPAGGILSMVQDFKLEPTREDSCKILAGDCTFYLEIEYINDILNKWRTYTIVTSLRDQKGPYSLVEHESYNDNRDTIINRPLQ